MVAFADQVNFFDMDLIKQKVLECKYSRSKGPECDPSVRSLLVKIASH